MTAMYVYSTTYSSLLYLALHMYHCRIGGGVLQRVERADAGAVFFKGDLSLLGDKQILFGPEPGDRNTTGPVSPWPVCCSSRLACSPAACLPAAAALKAFRGRDY